jgi:hypothetical protein
LKTTYLFPSGLHLFSPLQLFAFLFFSRYLLIYCPCVYIVRVSFIIKSGTPSLGSVVVRHCATSRTVLGSIPCGVTGFFSDILPSNHTMALGSTLPLVKMSTRNIPGGKGGRCVRLTTSPL